MVAPSHVSDSTGSSGKKQGQGIRRFGQELLAGGVAGACAKSSVAPLERIKIWMQTGRRPGAQLSCALTYMYKTDGVFGFYRGNGASVARIIPYAALHFATYEHYREALVHSLNMPCTDSSVESLKAGDKAPVWIDLLAGSCSGATAVVATYPLDLVRTRLALEVQGHKSFGGSIIQRLQKIVQQRGVAGLYRGMTPTLLGILPYAGFKFYVYQKLKRWWADSQPSPHNMKPPLYTSLAFGAISGLVSQTVTYPLDIVRRRVQIDDVWAKGKHPSMAGIFQDILTKQGWRGLFRGVHLNFLKIAPATAVGFAVYDSMKEALYLECHS